MALPSNARIMMGDDDATLPRLSLRSALRQCPAHLSSNLIV